MSLQNPVTPPGIDPGTVRLVAQCPNHYATTGPVLLIIIHIKTQVKVLKHKVKERRKLSPHILHYQLSPVFSGVEMQGFYTQGLHYK